MEITINIDLDGKPLTVLQREVPSPPVYDSWHEVSLPMRDDQRRLMWALWRDANGGNRIHRHDFTRHVLPGVRNPSWSGGGNLTASQASKIIDALNHVRAYQEAGR